MRLYIMVRTGMVFHFLFLRAVQESHWSFCAIWRVCFWQHRPRAVGTAK